MMTLSMDQALTLMHELETCYAGTNGYGGNTAEIYAYTLLPHAPTMLGKPPKPGDIFYEEYANRAKMAADNLGAVLRKFMSFYPNVRILIDGNERFDEAHLVIPFTHRVHVTVIEKD